MSTVTGIETKRAVWKWPFVSSILDEFNGLELQLPKGACVLDVQVQRGMPVLWALVDPTEDTETRYFYCFGTGHDIPNGALVHIGTVQLHGGNLILHFFELGTRKPLNRRP